VRKSKEEERSSYKADELHGGKGLEASRQTGFLFTSSEVL